MNAKQKLHQANLAKWTALFKQQSSCGLTIKDWCAQNNISVHTYNYWKHAAKEMYVESFLPDIVPIAPMPIPSLPPDSPDSQQFESFHSLDLRNSLDPDCLSILIGDIRIEIGASALDEIVSGIIMAVRHV